MYIAIKTENFGVSSDIFTYFLKHVLQSIYLFISRKA